MTRRDRTGDGPLPPAEEAVRRLLADARATDPAPPEVVARIDGVLADLAAERSGPPVTADPGGSTAPSTAGGDDLAARRRRRQQRRRGLVAAAAVVTAVGVGGVVLGGGGLDAVTSGDSAGGGAAPTAGRAEESAPLDDRSVGGEGADRSGPPELTLDALGDAALPRLSARRFVPQVQALVGGGALLDDTRSRERSRPSAGSCPDAVDDTGPGARVVAVRYDGAPARLVVREPTDGRSVVDLYVCGRPGVARSVLVDLP